jgi:hypothetical protein
MFLILQVVLAKLHFPFIFQIVAPRCDFSNLLILKQFLTKFFDQKLANRGWPIQI